MKQGYLFIALGQFYIDECVVLATTLRKNGDYRPISLLVQEADLEYAKKYDIIDQTIIFKPHGRIWNDCHTSFEKYCLYPRLHLDEYLIYDETIITDSDVLCQYSTENLWKFLTEQEKCVIMLGRKNDDKWHWGHIKEVSEAYGKHVPHVHGGFFYLRKDEFLKEFFAYSKDIFYYYDLLKCRREFRGGKVDEIIFAITHSNYDMSPLEFDDVPVMTFNYTSNIEIPSKLQTEGNQNVMLNDYIPFVHMFDKLGGENHKSLYNKIMEK